VFEGGPAHWRIVGGFITAYSKSGSMSLLYNFDHKPHIKQIAKRLVFECSEGSNSGPVVVSVRNECKCIDGGNVSETSFGSHCMLCSVGELLSISPTIKGCWRKCTKLS
jgi:hypothetical protein